jgi:hypothetical protein
VCGSIEESKRKGVFICEYFIDSVNYLNGDQSSFILEKAWGEKYHFLDLDNSGNEFDHVLDTCTPNIVLLLRDTCDYNIKNFMKTWSLEDDYKNPYGLTQGRMNISRLYGGIEDSLNFIVKKCDSLDFNHGVPICKVWLKKIR